MFGSNSPLRGAAARANARNERRVDNAIDALKRALLTPTRNGKVRNLRRKSRGLITQDQPLPTRVIQLLGIRGKKIVHYEDESGMTFNSRGYGYLENDTIDEITMTTLREEWSVRELEALVRVAKSKI